jgi:hypothetical protein
MFKALALVFIIPFIGCKRDAYLTIPIGSLLTKEILIKSEQITPVDNELILTINISNDAERYDPHLFFFDSSLRLYSACYFPSERIESIKNGVISAYLNKSRNSRKSSYTNDLPNAYQFDFLKEDGGSGQICNKIIDSIIIEGLNLKLIIRRAKDIYAGVEWNSLKNNKKFIDKFEIKDILTYPISSLSFNYKDKTVSFRETNSSNHLVWDKMIIENSTILDNFYDKLFLSIIQKKNGSF